MDQSSRRGSSSQHHHHHQPHPSISDTTTSNDPELSPRVRFAEGEPQTSYQILRPPAPSSNADSSVGTGTIITRSENRSSLGPSIYWDDRLSVRDIERESDANLVGYTFYREPTPPPGPPPAPLQAADDFSEKRSDYGSPSAAGGLAVPGVGGSVLGSGSGGGGGGGASDRDFSSVGPTDPNEAGLVSGTEPGRLSPRTMKILLWVAVVFGVLVIVGICVGVGVGFTVGVSKAQSTPTNATTSSTPTGETDLGSNPINDVTDMPGTRTAAPDSTSTAATTAMPTSNRPIYNSDCPALNNTVYYVPGSTKTFRRYCGIDYSAGNDGATELAYAWTTSMAECMHTCASFNECTACAWGYIEGDEGEKHRCYMKKDLTKSSKAASDWCFAVLETT